MHKQKILCLMCLSVNLVCAELKIECVVSVKIERALSVQLE